MADATAVTISFLGNASGVVAAAHQTVSALGAVDAATGKTTHGMTGIETAASKAASGFSGLVGIAGSVTSALGQIGLAAQGIQSIVGAATGAGKAIGLGLATELENVTSQFNAMTKDGAVTAGILADIRAEANRTPFAFQEMAKAAASLMPASKQSGIALMDLIKTAEILAASNPAEGLEGAAFSIREALSGDFVSIVERFNLPRQRLNELKAQGVPAMEAIRTAMTEMGLDADLVSNMATTMTGRWSTFMDAVDGVRLALATPLFDVLKDGLVGIQAVFDENAATITEWATTIGRAIGTTVRDAFRQLGDAVRTVQQVFADDWLPSDEIDPFVNLVGKAATAVRDLSRWFEGLSPGVKAAAAGFVATVAAAGPLVAAFSAASGIIAAVGAALAFLVSPLGLVAAAVAALAFAWTENLGGIQEKTAALVATVGPYFDQLVTVVTTALSGDIAGAFEQFKTLIVDVGAAIGPLLAQWGQEFVDWITVAGPPMLEAAAQLGADLLTWIAAQVAPLTAQLLLWGEQFVAWVAPQIPPLLAEAQRLGGELLTWIAAQIPPLIEALLAWGAEFVAWVQPQIPLLKAELITLGQSLIDWITSMVPIIVPELVKWGLLFGAWVVTTGLPELVKGLMNMKQAMIDWAIETGAALAPNLIALGKAIVQGIFDGFSAGWAQIGPKIKESIASAFTMPSLSIPGLGGPGAPSTQNLSLNTGGANAHVAPWMSLIEQISAEENEDPALVAAIMETEGSGAGSTSPAGAKGLMQTMPNWTRPGENPHDPATSIRLGIRAIKAKRAAVGSDPVDIAGAYFGYGTDAGGMTTGEYQRRFREKYTRYKGATGAPPMQRIPLGGPGGPAAPFDAGPLPPFMNETFESLPAYLQSLDTIQQQGVETYTQVATTGKEQGLALMGSQTDALGSVMSVYATAGGDIIRTTTDANGQVLSQYATMASGVTLNMDDLAAGVTTSTTQLGANILTTVTDTAGTYVTTITDMGGQIVSQFAGIAGQAIASTAAASTGVTEQYNLMATGAQAQVTTLAQGTQTVLQDAAGNYITTVTSMSGEVLSQYGTLANGVVLTTTDQNVKTTQSYNEAAGTIIQTVTDQAGNVITTTTDMSGKVIAQTVTTQEQVTQQWTTTSANVIKLATDMGLEVLGQSRKMGDGLVTATKNSAGEMVSIITNAAGEVIGEFKNIVEGGKTVATGLDAATKGLSKYADGLKGVAKEAKKAADAIEDFNKHAGGSRGGSPFGRGTPGKGSFGERHSGGPVEAGVPYLVGKTGAEELFIPSQSGQVVTGRVAQDGGKDGVDEDRLARAIARELAPLAGRGDLNVYGAGTEEVVRRVRDELEREAQIIGALRGV